MSPADEPYQYEIDLREGELLMQVATDDVLFVARQMQRCYDLILGGKGLMVALPPEVAVRPVSETAVEAPVDAPAESAVTVAIPPASPPPVDQAALLQQIQQLQEQVLQLMIPPAPSPEVSSVVDTFASPAHEEIWAESPVEMPLTPEPEAFSAGSEQAVNNPSMVLDKNETNVEPEMGESPSFEASPPVPNAEPMPVENFMAAFETLASEALPETPSAPDSASEEELDAVLNSMMSDLASSKALEEPPVAMEPAPQASSLEAPLDPFEAELAAVFGASEPVTEAPSLPEFSIEKDQPVSPLDFESALATALADMPEPQVIAPSIAAEPEVVAFPEAALPEPVLAIPSEPAVAPAPFPQMPTLPSWEDLPEPAPPEDQRHAHVEGEPDPFPTPDIQEKSERGFGIAGPPPTDDPKLRRLNMEKLQIQSASVDDISGLFPKSADEMARDTAKAADLFVAPTAPPAPTEAVVAPVTLEEDDLFASFGTGKVNAMAAVSAAQTAADFAPPTAPAAPAAPPKPVHPKGQIPQVENLMELCDMAPNATSGPDFMLLTAYFLSQIKRSEKYSLKDINTQLVRSGLTPVNHGILETVVTQNYMQLVPDLAGMSQVAEYTLTEGGCDYVDSLLAG